MELPWRWSPAGHVSRHAGAPNAVDSFARAPRVESVSTALMDSQTSPRVRFRETNEAASAGTANQYVGSQGSVSSLVEIQVVRPT